MVHYPTYKPDQDSDWDVWIDDYALKPFKPVAYDNVALFEIIERVYYDISRGESY